MAKQSKIPHTYVIIAGFIILAAMLTWVVPGGQFERKQVVVNETVREVVKGDSFEFTQSQPQTWQVFSALFDGFVDKADIIAFILIIGGAFWILNSSRAIDVGIYAFLRKSRLLEKNKLLRKIGVDNIIITLIMLMFSVFGATFGMSEETIAFTIIFVPMAISMGYDSLTGVAMCFVAAGLGFAGAILNPFTIGIAQGLSGLPLFSGLEYRIFCWIVINLVGISYILWYVRRIKRNPMRSLVYEEDKYWRNKNADNDTNVDYHTPRSGWITYILLSAVFAFYAFRLPLTEMSIGASAFIIPVMPVLAVLFIVSNIFALRKSVHFFVLNLLGFTILMLIVGVMGYGWYIMEIATLFMGLGIFSGIAMGFSANTITTQFIDGVKDILTAALVVGLAAGIVIVLERGEVIDTLLFYAAKAMDNFGNLGTVWSMYGIQTAINVIITSGSAKAALTIPIMSEFSDLIGLSRQATVMAFQFGDGFTNLIVPTSPILIGVLGIARIPYTKWVKWATPLVLILMLLGALLLIPTVTMELNGF
jgi:uncharacterized ion transporter superfamily protein YfcC